MKYTKYLRKNAVINIDMLDSRNTLLRPLTRTIKLPFIIIALGVKSSMYGMAVIPDSYRFIKLQTIYANKFMHRMKKRLSTSIVQP
jgi:hypothetical protein